MPIIVGDLGLAVLCAIASMLRVRRLPTVLEIVLLRRFPAAQPAPGQHRGVAQR
ncbi:hypothetical protein [Candidatus Accumulibacter sp. ACC003]|uniref:hypothetical protein n=1 Tax=Candidatus Accumulibacter sp. ACC003 TaxID=2823334 RepID=UPI0025B9D4CF|nr:hypothetical protein [Candidatus Accumulibacter sp. ACC003]